MAPRDPAETALIAAVVYPGVQVLDITGPLEVFDSARRLAGGRGRIYRTELLGQRPGPVSVSGGLKLVADRSWRVAMDGDEPIDTLIIPGAVDVRPLCSPVFLDWLRDARHRVRRLVSVCSGALVLAEAGILDGLRATTHWESCAKLADYPHVDVEPDAIFVRDGGVYTSAGITAGIDLALALVEEDHGRELAMATARELVVFLRRPGGQSQFSPQLLAQFQGDDRLGELLQWILGHLDEALTVESLAARVGMSPRNFSRVFKRRVEMTPAKFVELARLDEARRRLAESHAPLKTVAAQTGFGSVERMRRSFDRHLQIRPSDYRRMH